MLPNLFDSSTIPALEQVVSFTQARHGVLAGNIANMDTPGYKTRDLSPDVFQERLKEAIEAQRAAPQSDTYRINAEAAGRESYAEESMEKVRESVRNILFHDNSDVGIEEQVSEIAKNQSQHNLALQILTSQFRLLEAAITERA